MSSKIDQKAYLQKYLRGPSDDKKKKKKKTVKGKGFKIIDDDIDLSKIRALDGDELDILDQGEDAPQIAGIIDERPEEIKKLEQFKTSSKWRVVNQDDGFNSKLQIEEIKMDVKEREKENELIFGKMYSDSEDEKEIKDDNHSENAGPSKKQQNHSNNAFSPPRRTGRESPPKKRKSAHKNYDSDASPPRKHQNVKSAHGSESKYDEDPSPPKKHISQKVRKPSRWGDADQPKSKQRSDSDTSPPRKSRKQRNSELSPKRDSSKKRQSSDSDISPPRKSSKVNKQKNYDSDVSPPRKSRKEKIPKKRNRSPDSDVSPPRKRKQSPVNQDRHRYKTNDKYDQTNHRNTNDRDKSNYNQIEKSRRQKQSSDSDLSPIRQDRNKKNISPSWKKSRKHSPQRKHDNDSDPSSPRRARDRNYKKNSDSPPPSNKKMAKTLEGKKAGLQDAGQLRQENEAFRRREDEAFIKMADEVSGRNAKVVARRSKRETSEERQKQKEKAERQRELDEKYKKWSKGLKQIQDQEARVQEYIHEAAKPLARHRDDADLEDRLRRAERAEDPMLQYVREKRRERGELPPEKPTYKGSFPPNRFNIRPGYRWDGVDRSNGYEKKYFEHQSKRKAQEEEVYKWSTEDL